MFGTDDLRLIWDNLPNICDSAGSPFIEFKANYNCYRLVGRNVPLSIQFNEFCFIYRTIVENNLKMGYECATGFGVSTLAAALAFSETHGHLITIDNYTEESTGVSRGGNNAPNVSSLRGLDCVRALLHEHGVQNTVNVVIGTSPQDVPLICHGARFDFLFLDALHTSEALKVDFEAIVPYVKMKLDGDSPLAILVHDTNCYGQDILKQISSFVGKDGYIPQGCRRAEGGWDLMCFERDLWKKENTRLA